MFDSLLLLVTAAFLLAGFVKGALGLGLPTVSMGLLAVSMPPAQAIAIVIVPAIVTNIWQTFGGPYLRAEGSPKATSPTCRTTFMGERGFWVAQAGQRSWQRLHFVQASAS